MKNENFYTCMYICRFYNNTYQVYAYLRNWSSGISGKKIQLLLYQISQLIRYKLR